MPLKDPEARKAYQKKYFKKWYAENKESFKLQVAEINRKKRKELRIWINEYKGERGCNRCPENNPVCLDFHHNDGKKEGNISDMESRRLSKEKIIKEINKCIILCVNCHRKEHHKP